MGRKNMVFVKKNIIRQTILWLLTTAILNGCFPHFQKSSALISRGDRVKVDYQCLLDSGALFAATFAVDNDIPKSTVFTQAMANGPVAMEAGAAPEPGKYRKTDRHVIMVLEEQIQKQLADKPYEEEFDLVVSSDEEFAAEAQGTISIRRTDYRTRRRMVQRQWLVKKLGSQPEVGDLVSWEDPKTFPVKVVKIEGDRAEIELLPEGRNLFYTPFGPALFTEDDNGFRLYIQPEVGYLVRSGGWIGRVVSFDEETIRLDYRNPFGYEKLHCKIWVHGPEGRDE